MSVEPLDDIVELARQAGMSEADPVAFAEDGPLFEMEQEPFLCTVFQPFRAVRFVDTARRQVDDGTANMDTSDDDAVDAAVQQAGLLWLFGDDRFAPFRVPRLCVSAAERDQPPEDERVVDLGVVLARQLDGLDFVGQGGNVVMYLGPGLLPTGFERTARRIAGIREPVAGRRGLDDVLGELDTFLGAGRFSAGPTPSRMSGSATWSWAAWRSRTSSSPCTPSTWTCPAVGAARATRFPTRRAWSSTSRRRR